MSAVAFRPRFHTLPTGHARAVVSALVLFAVAASPVRARADEPPAHAFTEAQILEAEDRFREGNSLYESGRIDEARLKYAQAWAVLDRTTILWNLAVAESHSGKPVEAYRHFQDFVRRPDADADDVRRAQEKYLPACAALVGRIVVDAPAGTSLVLDDDLQLGAAPFVDPFAVSPGDHRLQTRLGDRVETTAVHVAAGETATVRIEAPAPPPPSPAASALLADNAAHAEALRRARNVTAVSFGAGALLGLGVGIAFSLDSQSKKSGNDAYLASQPEGFCADAASEACVTWNQRLQAQRTSATVATVGYVAAGTLAVSAAAAWIFWPKPRSARASVWAVPFLDGTAAEATSLSAPRMGLTVGGRF